VHTLAGVAAGVFAVLILLGSVMLGWHYAIDGYAGALGVLALWWFSGHIVRWLGQIGRRDMASVRSGQSNLMNAAGSRGT